MYEIGTISECWFDIYCSWNKYKYMVPTENVRHQQFFDSKNPNYLVVQQNELLSFRSIELLK